MTLPTDLRDALRSLRVHRTFSAAAVLTLAIGIGANTAVFSVVHAVLLRPLPYRDPAALAWIATTVPALRAEIVGAADYLAWRDQARSLASIAAWDEAAMLTLAGLAEPERVSGARVSASLLPTLGVQTSRGRGFSGADEKLNAAPVAILSDRLWRRLYGADTSPSGQLLRLDTGTVEVIGVLPADFVFPQAADVDVLLPLRLNEATERMRRMMSILRVIARLGPGVTLEGARAELTAVRDRSAETAAAASPLQPRSPGQPQVLPSSSGSPDAARPDADVAAPPSAGGAGDTFDIAVGPESAPPPDRPSSRPSVRSPAPPAATSGGPAGGQLRVEAAGPRPGPGLGGAHADVVVRSLHEQLVGDIKPALLLLVVTVALVLIVACANVANLVLARTTSRVRELAVRAALGASRWQIVRQVLTESMVVSIAGGLAGLVIAAWAVRVLMAAVPPEIAVGWLGHARVGIDPAVLAFSVALATVAGALAGIGPALAVTRIDVQGTLRDAAPSASAGPSRRRLRATLVVAEIGIAVVLLAGAGLLVRSFARLLAVDPGFRPDRVITMAIDVAHGPGDAARQRSAAFFATLAERARALPGVESIAYGDTVPLREYSTMIIGLQPEGGEVVSDGPPPEIAITVVSPDYFRTFGMRLARGRSFTAADRGDAPPVAIVNESMARQFWGASDPVGRRIRVGPRRPDWITVVGVVADVRHDGPATAARRAMYRPFDQEPMSAGFLAVRTTGEAASVVAAIRREVRALDASLVVYDVATMDQRMAGAIVGRRFSMLLVATLAAVALALAAVGLYGVLSTAVAERTREIGIRMALGARGADVVRHVMKQTALLVALGLVLGVAGALAAGPLVASALFEVSSRDPATLTAVPVVLGAAALAAAWLPARRATLVDPILALRDE